MKIEELKETENKQLTIDSVNERVREVLKSAEEIKSVFIVAETKQDGKEVAAVICCGEECNQLKLVSKIVPVAAKETAKMSIKKIMGPLEEE